MRVPASVHGQDRSLLTLAHPHNLGPLRLAALRLPRARAPHQLRETLAPRALECGDARPQRPALLTSKHSTG
jgi:hypothetical protein